MQDILDQLEARRVRARLGGGVHAPESPRRGRDAGREMDGPPGVRGAQQRLQRADQPVDGREVDLFDLGELARIGVGHRRQARRPHGRRRLDPDVQFLEPFEDRAAQPVDPAPVDQVERDEGRVFARRGEDGVVQFLKPALCPGCSHHVRASLGQGEGALVADPARGPDDEGDTVFEGQV